MSAVASIQVLPTTICLRLPIFSQEILSELSFDDCDEIVTAIRELLASKRRRRLPVLDLDHDAGSSICLERFAPNGGPIHFITFEHDQVRHFGGGMCQSISQRTFLQLEDAKDLADQLEEAVAKARKQIALHDEGTDFIESGDAPTPEPDFIDDDEPETEAKVLKRVTDNLSNGKISGAVHVPSSKVA